MDANERMPEKGENGWDHEKEGGNETGWRVGGGWGGGGGKFRHWSLTFRDMHIILADSQLFLT